MQRYSASFLSVLRSMNECLDGVADTDPFLDLILFFFSSRRRHTRFKCDWSSDVCSSDLVDQVAELGSSIVPSILQTAFIAIFVLSTMFVLNLRLACVLLPLMPLFVFLKRHYAIRLRRAADSAQEESSKENNFLQEHLSSVVQIQLL